MSTNAPKFSSADVPKDVRFAIAAARFNVAIVDELLAGCVRRLRELGVDENRIEVHRVPGAFELPVAAKLLGGTGRFGAIICLGAVIRGDTPHFDYVASEAAKGIAHVSSATGVPVAFGVLTTNTLEQAIDRAGAKSGNKGFDAAMTAIEMANLMKKLRQDT